ncbi:hypothetical protein KC960_04080 [Candidatus Saccharibacteria bacterium]|nr:hypothetical protein [Candidatus Saccharibacteria bacterium]
MDTITEELVTIYDTTNVEQDGCNATGYFWPPIGEAICADLCEVFEDLKFTDTDVAGRQVEHYAIDEDCLIAFIDRASTLLQREGRCLEK